MWSMERVARSEERRALRSKNLHHCRRLTKGRTVWGSVCECVSDFFFIVFFISFLKNSFFFHLHFLICHFFLDYILFHFFSDVRGVMGMLNLVPKSN